MLCRIQVSGAGQGATVHVAGHLAGGHVNNLLEVCEKMPGHVSIDLADLLTVDRVGIDVLRRLADAGVDLVGVPRYLQFELTPHHDCHGGP